LFEFQTHGSLAEQGFFLVEGVNGQGTGLHGPGFARCQGVGVAFSGNHEICAVGGYLLNFRGGGDFGDEYLGWHPALHRGVCDGGAVISA
jgi:hypothetical protein